MAPTGPAADAPEAEIQVGNEFAVVRVQKVTKRNGERLEIVSARSGSRIELDPVELEALTLLDHDFLSALLFPPTSAEAQ